MRLSTFILILVIFFVCESKSENSSSFSSWPSFPSLTNLAMIKRLMKFYTLRSKSERSELCEEQSQLLYNGVQNFELWAARIVDASARIPTGISKGHFADFGYFDECINVKNKKIPLSGKYCIAKIKADSSYPYAQNMTNVQRFAEIQPFGGDNMLFGMFEFKWAICVPDGCTAKEVEDHLNKFAGVDIYKIEDESQCQTAETLKPKFNVGDWIVIGGLIILSVIIISSTVYDLNLYYTKTETYHPALIAFSWFTNFKKITKTNSNTEMLSSLNGIRFISMLWIVFGHQYEVALNAQSVNIFDFTGWMKNFSSMLIIGATVSVDSFFLLSGCLLMYGFLKSEAKKIPFNIPLFYLYIVIYAAIIFMVTLIRFMGLGPLWTPDTLLTDSCKKYWWSSLLYIQNYVAPNNSCIGPTWYLQLDMQLYILSPLILIPIKIWPKIAGYLFNNLIILFVLIPTIYAWHYRLAAFVYLVNKDTGNAEHFSQYYQQAYTRAGPWMVGLLLGYLIFKGKQRKTTLSLNKFVVVLLWPLSLAAMLYCIFGFYPETQSSYVYDRLFNALFIGLHRVVWAAGLSWIIFACEFGYGGPINAFLSQSVFQVLSRLCYSLYLIHGPFLLVRMMSLQMPVVFSDMNVWRGFCESIISVMIIALIWTLTFESPFIVLDSLLMKSLSRARRRVAPTAPTTTNITPEVAIDQIS